MNLYIVRFADNSYQVIIRASNFNSAKEKAIEYIKKNHSWYAKDYNFKRLDISIADEDFVIE